MQGFQDLRKLVRGQVLRPHHLMDLRVLLLDILLAKFLVAGVPLVALLLCAVPVGPDPVQFLAHFCSFHLMRPKHRKWFCQ